MGRTRVSDSERKRALVACTVCRASKRKCSGSIPCVLCMQRGAAASCVVANTSRKSRNGRSAPVRDPITALNSQSSQCLLQTVAIEHTTISREPVAEPRMLRTLRGEQVYVGQAASISFLQLVREIVYRHIGPSQFSHNDQTESMLETQSSNATTPLFSPPEVHLDLKQLLCFSEFFESAVDGLLDIFAPLEIKGLLSESSVNPSHYRNAYKRATVDLIIAIGAQCHSPSSAVGEGHQYSKHAQQLALSEVLEDPNVDLVRSFLLMAFYMLGCCRRNAAFMYIGIAVRAAVTLGLHSRKSYADMSLPRYQLRLRIWLSLCILDMTISAILGRPAATSALRAELEADLEDLAADMNKSEMNLGSLVASYMILTVIINIVDDFYRQKPITEVSINIYLLDIEAWKVNYGSAIMETPASISPSSVGSVHLSCLHHFAITLVTRPILIPVLTRQNSDTGKSESVIAQLCIDAATSLVKVCAVAHKRDLFLGNMCILKALVLIAGLILGLQRFFRHQIDDAVDLVYSDASRILQFLAAQSPQAAHYFEILSLLSTAIARQHEISASKEKSKSVSRVDSVLSLHRAIDENPTVSTDTQCQFQFDTIAKSELAGTLFAESVGEELYDWDHFDITQWDDFQQLSYNPDLNILDE
ncbi:fungal-specific transcription factor domain-containing protein [Calycina marina]|uniref:Fungal-specific transcription factor domain-containing protein n=1 Tax=Calycina marina TaxID=1763456 RepID=A0A9P7Z552_9HELO|nr:fungal-specific transcription factor domain-containing protein [Calycina marina]